MKIGTSPMMSQAEINIIDGLIDEHRPKYCLEWGSGMSTAYFAKRDYIKLWLAVEHNGNYVKHLQDHIADNTIIIWADHEWYIDSVKHSRHKFDFILIDGRMREQCLDVAFHITTAEAVILLHDSGREDYQSFIKKYRHDKLTEGEVKQGDYYAHRGLTRFYR